MDALDVNVWGDVPNSPPQAPKAPQPRPLSSTKPIEFSSFEDDAFTSTLDDVGTSIQHDDDDDFGDFGDFGDVVTAETLDEQELSDFGEVGFQHSDELAELGTVSLPSDPGPSTWIPLRLRPMPPRDDLIRDVGRLLAPAFGHVDTNSPSEPIRQVEGIGQILVTPSRFASYRRIKRSI